MFLPAQRLRSCIAPRLPDALSAFLLILVLGSCRSSQVNETHAVATPRIGLAPMAAQPTGQLTVFAAASLTEPFTEIGRRLETLYPSLRIVYNFGGSSALRTQLEQGARADVFASADSLQMDLARQAGVVQDEAFIFAKNRLVVIVPKRNPTLVTEFRDLSKPGVKVVLAAPAVPVGNYSRQILHRAAADYGVDFGPRVLRNLLSEEENAKQVVAKVQLGEADAGIVFSSDVTPQVSKDVLTIPIPEPYSETATYLIALTKGVRNRPAAEAFIAFVLSNDGQAVLQAHNFIPIRE